MPNEMENNFQDIRQNNPAPGVRLTRVILPHSNDWGSGSFEINLEPNALASPNPILCAALNKPYLQITVNINPQTSEVPVLLGTLDGSPPKSRRTYRLPKDIPLSRNYVFLINFKSWSIQSLLLNGIQMSESPRDGSLVFWVDPRRNPGAFTPGHSYNWGTFISNSETCTVYSEGSSLIAVKNKGTDRELMIFDVSITANPSHEHMIAVTWSDVELCLYFDGRPCHSLPVQDFLK